MLEIYQTTTLLFSLVCLLLHLRGKRRIALFREWRKSRMDQGSEYNYSPPIQFKTKRIWSIKGEGWNETDCLEYLRFTNSEIQWIITALDIPKRHRWRSYHRATPEEAFCLFLYRLSHPHRLKDCMKVFGKSRTWCSSIFNDMALYICRRWKTHLEWDEDRLTLSNLQSYATAIESTCGVGSIWGFIDGTHRPISRPVHDQEDYYTGAKKQHGIRFQGIVTPDGIITLSGPWHGPTGDWRMWQESAVEARLRALFETIPDNKRLFLYGDPAYYPGYGIMGPFRPDGRQHRLTPEEEAANIVMSGQRIVVEWGFGLISKYWTFTAFGRANRIGLSPVGAYYICATLLTNVHTCLRGNQISEKYDFTLPTLEEYLKI